MKNKSTGNLRGAYNDFGAAAVLIKVSRGNCGFKRSSSRAVTKLRIEEERA